MEDNLLHAMSKAQFRQEYPTEALDKIPARQAEFELAGKKKTLAS